MVQRALAATCLLLAALVTGAAEPEVRRGIPYAAGGEDRTLDLYLPDRAEPAPLFVFVHGRFWREVPDPRRLDAILARPLQRAGAAVAVVRHRLAPGHRHPAQAQDVAAALAYLVGEAGSLGIDPARIFLAGHASGAQLAALVALDPSHLAAHGLAPSLLAGVVAISGIFDLDPGDAVSPEERALYTAAFGDRAARRAASPLRRVHAGAPPFLVLTGERDIPGYAEASRAFADALRAAGSPEVKGVMLQRDHETILDFRETDVGTALFVLHFLGLGELPPLVAALDASERYWRSPRLSSEPLWKTGARVRERAVDARFLAETRRLFVSREREREGWRPERYHAVDLYELLDALGPERVGEGRWLTLTNAQGEKTTLDLEAIRAARPVVVVGVDDERNLFRRTDMHWALREYSWRDELPRPPPLARPMGAFLYFLEGAEGLLPPTLGHFSLDASSFARSAEDPLAPLRDVAAPLLEVLTTGNGCVQCHTFRGVGARAGHLRAVDGELVGGFALPLESYPPEVLRRFVFDPAEAAARIGTSVNAVPEPLARAFHDLVAAERGAGG